MTHVREKIPLQCPSNSIHHACLPKTLRKTFLLPRRVAPDDLSPLKSHSPKKIYPSLPANDKSLIVKLLVRNTRMPTVDFSSSVEPKGLRSIEFCSRVTPRISLWDGRALDAWKACERNRRISRHVCFGIMKPALGTKMIDPIKGWKDERGKYVSLRPWNHNHFFVLGWYHRSARERYFTKRFLINWTLISVQLVTYKVAGLIFHLMRDEGGGEKN